MFDVFSWFSRAWPSAVVFQLLLGACAFAADPPPNILVAIADDWSRHAGVYGDPVVKTPVFDRVAREGALFRNAHCAAPSCSPSRAALLTGRMPHELEEGGNLWGTLPAKFALYTDLLRAAGYDVACEGKGWGPGDWKGGGREIPPAGRRVKTFEEFWSSHEKGKPFCFWFGSSDPHRPYQRGSGIAAGMKPEDVQLPPYWPDSPEVRSDMLDYYFEVQRFDGRVGEILKTLADAGELENTIVIITSDNGMPFPRAKATVYELGTAVPLAIRWPAGFQGGLDVSSLVSLSDLAPTILEATGKPVPQEMSGRSLLPILKRTESPDARDKVFVERERHAHVRQGNLSYPSRAIRTRDYLYIRNFRPERWPAGDPEMVFSVGKYGDVDDGPTKRAVIRMLEDPATAAMAKLSLGKHPAEELYALSPDPHEMVNVAGHTEHAETEKRLRAELDGWMSRTGDPRATSDDDPWDRFPYTGTPGPGLPAARRPQ